MVLRKACGGNLNSKCFVCSLIMTTILVIAVSTDAAADPNFTVGALTSIESGWGGEGIYMIVTPAPSPACNGKIFMPTSAIQYKENLALAMLALSQSLPVAIYYGATCDANGSLDFVSLSIG